MSDVGDNAIEITSIVCYDYEALVSSFFSLHFLLLYNTNKLFRILKYYFKIVYVKDG